MFILVQIFISHEISLNLPRFTGSPAAMYRDKAGRQPWAATGKDVP